MRLLTIAVLFLFALPPSIHAQDDPDATWEVGFAPGILFTANVLGDDVQTEDIVDAQGIVQTTAIETSRVRPALEAHTLGRMTSWLRLGPFVGIELGDTIIQSVGAGTTVEILGFPISIGYWVNPTGKVRRGDFVPGEPAPHGATQVEYVTRSVKSLAIMAHIPVPF